MRLRDDEDCHGHTVSTAEGRLTTHWSTCCFVPRRRRRRRRRLRDAAPRYVPVPSGVLPYVRFSPLPLPPPPCPLSSSSFSCRTLCRASSELWRCSGLADGRSRMRLPSALLEPCMSAMVLSQQCGARGEVAQFARGTRWVFVPKTRRTWRRYAARCSLRCWGV